jgi:hypothetical protein
MSKRKEGDIHKSSNMNMNGTEKIAFRVERLIEAPLRAADSESGASSLTIRCND